MDIFGIKKLEEYFIKKNEMKGRLKNLAFETVENSQEYIFELLNKKGLKEYWDWKINFDLKKYNIRL